ncbi:hypothetical protein CAPTEDRAFT_138366 [Capitella teleta]|uniref:Sulfatase N-terminal domain-containing protein n=1 Tax=Capitella teleta TaxID=283909 RepID=R7VHZ2_CAPTE|nr:hypothetical protein CAPTEDRAFT_138366 [Capitella teleta]|eukprot:ELU18214.1 hypothetical protein CAPTEDRAFT_138366 [Capitella teleta]
MTTFPKLLLCLTVITVFVVLLLALYSQPWTATQPGKQIKYVVNTPGCNIVDVDPFDEAVQHMVRKLDPLQCNATTALTYIEGSMLRINRSVLNAHYAHRGFSHCEYQAIHRPQAPSDDRFVYGELIEILTDSLIKDEFIRISCMANDSLMMYTNFHTVIQHRTKSGNLKDNNVIMVGVDSVSRLNFIRQFPKTRRFMLEMLGGVEYKGYNKVDDNTFVNLVPMFSGKFVKELDWDEVLNKPFDDVPFIWKNFSQKGYVTAIAEDAPNIAIFNYDKPGFHHPPTDHYLRPFSLALEDHRSLWNTNHDCFGPTLESDIVLNYVEQFISHYEGSVPFWVLAFITRLTHDNIHKASLADDSYLNFFRNLHKNGRLKNAFVIFFSDHGMRFGEIRETSIGKLEERLPFLYVAVPEAFKSTQPKQYQNLITNSERLTTPFDIYEVLSFIVNADKPLKYENPLRQRGMNLFCEISPERTCEDAGIDAHWCTCYGQEVVDPASEEIQTAVAFLVRYINRKLEVHHGLCEVLSLEAVTDARKISSEASQFLLTFKTQPGGALFEATVFLRGDGTSAISGDISRINAYGDQSMCIENHGHKKFCMCT